MMSIADATLMYLLLFRLAIIAAAMLSMTLGYKLFHAATGMERGRSAGTTIESSVGTARIFVKNAAPGTVFALFGAILLVVMLVQSSPSVTLETISKARTHLETKEAGGETQTEKMTFRGDDSNSIAALTRVGIAYDSRGDVANAERSYREAVTQMAEPINDLAWLYIRSGRTREALGLAKLAVELRPDEPRYTDTLAKASHPAP